MSLISSQPNSNRSSNSKDVKKETVQEVKERCKEQLAQGKDYPEGYAIERPTRHERPIEHC
jgi:hypothetical protein